MTETAARRVYVIDDDRDVLASAAFLLPALGYECVTFSAPEEFLGRVGELPCGCVLTDLRMPVMDGFALAKRILELGLDWPVLMMTSDNGENLSRRASKSGISAILHKPVDANLLADALSAAFGRCEA